MPTPYLVGDQLPDYIGQTTSLDLPTGGSPQVQFPAFLWTNGKLYQPYVNVLTDGSFRQFISVGASTDGGRTFVSQDPAGMSECNADSVPSIILDKINSRILFLVIDFIGDDTGISTASVANGGTGYTMGDIGLVSGGYPGQIAQYRVTGVSGGVVTSVTITFAGGGYPTSGNPYSTTTTGGGAGLTLDVTGNTTASNRQDGVMSIRSFNLTTGLWDTPVATGGPLCFLTGLFNDLFGLALQQVGANAYSVTYYSSETNYPTAPLSPFFGWKGLATVLVTSGSWGVPVQLYTLNYSNPNDFSALLGVGADSDGNTNILWSHYDASVAPSTGARAGFSQFSALGSLSSFTTIYTSTADNSPPAGYGTYLSTGDVVVFGYTNPQPSRPSPPFPSNNDLIKIENSSTSPTAVVEALPAQLGMPDPTANYGPPNFFTDATDSTWYVGFVEVTLTGGPLDMGMQSLIYFQRPAAGTPGAWTGPTVFWSAATNPPTIAVPYPNQAVPTGAPLPAELDASSFAFIDGALTSTVGMLSGWCGVIFFLGAVASSPGDITLSFRGMKVYG